MKNTLKSLLEALASWAHAFHDAVVSVDFLWAIHAALFAAFSLLAMLFIYFLKERTDLEKKGALIAGVIAAFCGAVYHGSVLWPQSELLSFFQGYVRTVYAVSAVAAVCALWRVMPAALHVPSSRQLNEAFENLSGQIAVRKQSQKDLLEREKLIEEQGKELARLIEIISLIESEKKKNDDERAGLAQNIEGMERALKERFESIDGLNREISARELQSGEKQKAWEAQLALHSLLLERAYGGTIIAARDGRILRDDGVFSRLTGYENGCAGLSLHDFMPEEDQDALRFIMAETDDGGGEPSLEVRINRRDGAALDLEMRIRNYSRDPAVGGYVINFQDVSLRRSMEEQINQFPAAIKELNEVGDIHSILEVALRRICETAGWEYGEAWVPRSDGKFLECSPSWYGDDALLPFRELSQELRIPPEAGLAGRLWVSGEPEWIEDIGADSGHELFRKNAAQTSGVRSAIGIPVGLRNEIHAVMLFFSRRRMSRQDRMIDWAMSLSAHIASVIERKKIEERLRLADSGAEVLVQERTTELTAENQNLNRELKDRKLVEESLRKSQAKNLALLNSIDGIVYEFDLRTSRYTFVSEQGQKLLGYNADLWLTETTFWYEHIHGGDREGAVNFRARAADQKTGQQFEYRMITSEGRTVWLRDMTSIVTDGGVPVKLRGVMVDITDRKLMEEALDQEKNFASTVLDTAGALVMILDKEGNVIRFNHACEQISRCPAQEILGKSFWEFFMSAEESERVRTIFARLLAGQFPMHYESFWLSRDGSTRNIAWTSTVLFSADGTVEHVVATGLDITRRKEIERQLTEAVTELAESNKELDKYSKELQEANGQLRKMDEIKSHFISAASHELKTPLTSLKGYVETILQGEAGPINDQQSEFLGYVKESTDRLHRLLNELLDISKIESGQVAMNIEPVNIRNLLKEEMMIFKPQADEKKITLGLEIAEGLRTVFCDSDKMREVMDNLISNAIKYTPKKGKVNIYARRIARKIHIDVEDTGIGIKQENLDKIFEPFRYIEKEGMETQEDSTGLGLTLVKRIVEAHGAEILVKSEPGRGSTFTVVLSGSDEIPETQSRHWAVTHE